MKKTASGSEKLGLSPISFFQETKSESNHNTLILNFYSVRIFANQKSFFMSFCLPLEPIDIWSNIYKMYKLLW